MVLIVFSLVGVASFGRKPFDWKDLFTQQLLDVCLLFICFTLVIKQSFETFQIEAMIAFIRMKILKPFDIRLANDFLPNGHSPVFFFDWPRDIFLFKRKWLIELSNVGFRLEHQPNRTIDRTIKNKICLGHFTECLIRSSIRKEVLDYRIHLLGRRWQNIKKNIIKSVVVYSECLIRTSIRKEELD